MRRDRRRRVALPLLALVGSLLATVVALPRPRLRPDHVPSVLLQRLDPPPLPPKALTGLLLGRASQRIVMSPTYAAR